MAENQPQHVDTERLRHLLFQVALAVTNPDRNHVDRCVDVLRIVGSAEDWRPLIDRSQVSENLSNESRSDG